MRCDFVNTELVGRSIIEQSKKNGNTAPGAVGSPTW